MSTFTTPARGRWPRSAVAGNVPTVMAPGSMAVNWIDQKIYVGNTSGGADLFSQLLREFNTNKYYYTGDLAIFQESIWQATQDSAPGSPFDQTRWKVVSDARTSALNEPVSTGVYSGGEVSFNAPNELLIANGEGVIVDNTHEVPTFSDIVWGNLTIPVTYFGEPWTVILISDTGAVSETALSTISETFDLVRRTHLVAAYVLLDNLGVIIDTIDASLRTGGTAETYIDEYSVNGGAYRASGGAAHGVAGTLGIATTAASVFDMGGNWRAAPYQPNIWYVDAIPLLTMDLIDRNGVTTAAATAGDPSMWDNGGALQPVPTEKYTTQYLTALPDMSKFFLQYGQTVYDTKQDAINAIAGDWDAFVKLIAADAPAMVIGAIISRQDRTDYDTSRFVNATRGLDPFNSVSEEVNTDDFYVLDGSRALTGAMDADGNAITNAILSGETNTIKPLADAVSGVVPATTSGLDAGEIFVNTADDKTYTRDLAGEHKLRSHLTTDYSATRVYAVGDLTIEVDVLYQCHTTVDPAEAFDPAKWKAIGASAASLDGAVILDPEVAGRNTVDTVGFPAVEALVIEGDPFQSADLVRIEGTASSDTGNLNIDSLGFPGPRFGAAAFRIGQGTHGFGPVGGGEGKAVAYDPGGNWILANGTTGQPLAVGILQEIIDANTLVIRQSGIVTGLDSASFDLAIQAATDYYVSENVPGQLTATRPTGASPVLKTIDTVSGIVFPPATGFVSKDGDTMNGNLTISNNEPGLIMNEEDQVTHSLHQIAASGGVMFLQSGDGAAGGNTLVLSGVSGTNLDNLQVISAGVLTDIILADGTKPMTGNLTVPDGVADAHAVNKGQMDTFVSKAGDTMTGNLSIPAGTVDAHAVNKGQMDTAVGDAPYLPLAGTSDNPMTGNLFLETGGKASTSNSFIYLGGYKDVDAQARLSFLTVGGDTASQAYITRDAGLDGAWKFVQNQGAGDFQFFHNGTGDYSWWMAGTKVMGLEGDGTLSVNPTGVASGAVVVGAASGGVALTINDGGGNANVTFNHRDEIPDQDGSSARITAAVDATTSALDFSLADNVTAGASTPDTSVLKLTTSEALVTTDLRISGTSPDRRLILDNTAAANPWEIYEGTGGNLNFNFGGTIHYNMQLDGQMNASNNIPTQATGDVRWSTRYMTTTTAATTVSTAWTVVRSLNVTGTGRRMAIHGTLIIALGSSSVQRDNRLRIIVKDGGGTTIYTSLESQGRFNTIGTQTLSNIGMTGNTVEGDDYTIELQAQAVGSTSSSAWGSKAIMVW